MTGTQKEISVSLQDIKDAQQCIKGKVNRTPLIRFYSGDLPGEIYLKLENLQPIGSFKIRGACNAMSVADRSHGARCCMECANDEYSLYGDRP
jgi:threonine dehydratase